MGFGGLELRARCAGCSVTEIGNRKERMRDYASFPDVIPKQVWAAAQRNPNRKKRSFRAECEAFYD